VILTPGAGAHEKNHIPDGAWEGEAVSNSKFLEEWSAFENGVSAYLDGLGQSGLRRADCLKWKRSIGAV